MPAKWKIKEVEELAGKLSESPVIAVAGVKGLPSKQMQEIRKKLHGDVEIKVVKNRLARRAFEKVDRKGLKDLEESINGPTAILFSKENPFKLTKLFNESRVKAPAKEGQEAPEDIVVPAGDTPFKPGPIIGDLQEVGIKAKIQGPIIAVVKDSPVIKKGETFSGKLAGVLAQMDIYPMEIGIDVRAAYEDGIVYGADTLSIDAEKVLSDMAAAHQHAINLSVEAGIFNKASLPVLLTKAAGGARSLAIEAEIYNEETIDYFLSKGSSEAKGLAASVSYEPGAKPAPEEKKQEEKKEESGSKEESPKEEPKEKASEEREAAEEITGEGAKGEDSEAAKEITEEEPKEAAKEEGSEAAKEITEESAKDEEAGKKVEEQNADTPAEDGGTQDVSPETEEKLAEEADPLEQVPEVGEEAEEEKESGSQNK